MKFNFSLFSIAILGVHQAIGAPASISHSSGSVSQVFSNSDSASPLATMSSLAAPTPMILPVAGNNGGTIMLDEELVQELGWSQKDADLLTGFLEAIEKLGDLNISYDPATRKLLTDFQTEARELIERSGYKYVISNDGTSRLVLTRISASDITDILNKGVMQLLSIPDLVEQLVQSLTSFMDTLKKRADGGSVIAQTLYKFVNSLLTKLGKTIEDHLFGSSSEPAPVATPAAVAGFRNTFLY